ncbi:MAG: GGDEF domain-containing protein [Acidimicrobiales bacterium]
MATPVGTDALGQDPPRRIAVALPIPVRSSGELVGAMSVTTLAPEVVNLNALPDDSPGASMLRGLLRIREASQAARLLQNTAVALGGSLVPAADAGPDALPLDLSLGEGEPVLVEADPMSVARLQLERFLPRLIEDAREAVDLLRRNERLEDASKTDRLTGLANRRVLDLVLPRTTEGAVILIDLDHFKQINDKAGHYAGDAVLADFGTMLRREVRDTDVCCRFGGEEFVIIAAGTTITQAVELTVRLRDAWVEVAPRPVTFSAGVAAITVAGAKEALEAADRALYRAKELGRDRTETELEPAGERHQ